MSKLVLPVVATIALVGVAAQSSTLFTLAIGAGMFWLFFGGRSGQSSAEPFTEWNDEWLAAGEELGFSVRPLTKKSSARMYGLVDGHKVEVSCDRRREPEIEVNFESGLRRVSIKRRSHPVVRSDRTEALVTGDPSFDEVYRIGAGHDEGRLHTWLDAERRDVLVTLAQTLHVDEIEEDELEARLTAAEWSSRDLVEAVRLCVLVATVLDESHTPSEIRKSTPQDAVIDDAGPQDAIIQDAPPDDAQ